MYVLPLRSLRPCLGQARLGAGVGGKKGLLLRILLAILTPRRRVKLMRVS